MDTPPVNTPEPPSIFGNEYDREVLLDNWQHGSLKAMKALFIIAAIFLVSDFIALSSAGLLNNGLQWAFILVMPALFSGLALLAKTKPLLSIILGIILYVAIIVLNVILLGGASLISGWLVKSAIIYFLLNGFNNAKEAEEAKKNLALFR